MYQNQKQFSGNLHALRGIAALMVLFYHAMAMPQTLDVGALSFVGTFGLGVTLFFILSGFSLSLSNYDKIDEANWLRGYSIKRMARILPVWWAFVTLTLVYHYFKYGVLHSPAEMLYNYTVTYSLVPGRHESFVWAGWTIGVEMMFYAIFPLLIVTIRDNIKGWLFLTLAFLGISVAMRAYANGAIPNSYMDISFPRRGFIFILGCLLYFITRRANKQGWSNIWGWNCGALGLISLMYWALAVIGKMPLSGDWSHFATALWVGFLTVFFYINPKIGDRHWFNIYNPFTRFLGDKSYTIYLAHPIMVEETRRFYPSIKNTVKHTELSFIVYCLLVMALTFIVATLISRYIEAPLYKRGRALASKPLPRTNT